MDGKQLKNSILQWAIQGKLVPQNPKDEPAQKLLERITASRNGEVSPKSEAIGSSKKAKKSLSTSLRGAKATKQSKALSSRIYRENDVWYEQVGTATPKDISDEIPFEIPENWALCRIKDICSKITDGTHHSPVNTPSGDYKYVTAKNIKDFGIQLSNISYVDKKIHEEIYARCNPNLGDILYIKDGATTGVCCINDLDEQFSLLSSVALLKPQKEIFAPYLLYCLRAPICYDSVRESMKGTGITRITLTKIEKWIIPLPPLAEQKRIVAKLEQVLPLAEEYGAAQEQLDKLNKELPEALKKSILQEAIQGKLVPQNPKDEPAQKLLERIAASRNESSLSLPKGTSSTSLRGAKATKQSKNPPSHIYRENGTWYEQIGNAEPKDISDEIPFDIPENWTWCRMGNFITIATGLAYKKEDLDVRAKSYIRVLRGGNIDYGKWSLKEDDVFIAPQFVKDDLILKKGTFITPAVTSLEQMGKTALIESDQKDLVVGGFVLMLSSVYNDEIFLKYILNVFQSYYYKQYCQSITNKSGQAFYNLSRQKLLQCFIPLPPLAEQKRIVAKLEQLFKVL